LSARAIRLAWALLPAGALLALAAAPAGATITTASKSITINPGRTGSVAATCAPGTVPVSAGFLIKGFNFNTGGIAPFATVRLPGGSSATGRNVGSVAGTLTDYAYCDTNERMIVVRSVHAQLPIKKSRALSASCPTGTTPLSGGYRFTNGVDGTGAAFRSRKVRGGWEVAGYNDGPGKSAFTVFVYCQRNGPQLATRTSATSIPNFTLGSAQAACPAGTRVVSGGFDGHLVLSPSLRVAFPLGSNRVQNSWRARAAAGTDGPNAKLTVFAYCEPT
jgi:hypothetical protein